MSKQKRCGVYVGCGHNCYDAEVKCPVCSTARYLRSGPDKRDAELTALRTRLDEAEKVVRAAGILADYLGGTGLLTGSSEADAMVKALNEYDGGRWAKENERAQ